MSKIQRFKQSHLEATFATPDSTLTVPNYRVRGFQFLKKIKFSVKFFKKSQKNVILGKLQRFEHSQSILFGS